MQLIVGVLGQKLYKRTVVLVAVLSVVVVRSQGLALSQANVMSVTVDIGVVDVLPLPVRAVLPLMP